MRTPRDALLLRFASPHGPVCGWSVGPEDGPLTVCVHGWGAGGGAWVPMAGALARSGRRVLALDMPAHGLSLRETPPASTATLKIWTDALCAVLAEAAPPNGAYHLLGHSFGALTAAFACVGPSWAAVRAPAAERLTLIAAPAGMTTVVAGHARSLRLPPEDVLDIVRDVEAVLAGPLISADLAGAAVRLPSDLRLIHDPEDVVAPLAELAALRALRPDARLLEAAGTGHDGVVLNRGVIRAVAEG